MASADVVLTTRAAGEAVCVVEVPHGLAGLAGPVHSLPTFDADTCRRRRVSKHKIQLCVWISTTQRNILETRMNACKSNSAHFLFRQRKLSIFFSNYRKLLYTFDSASDLH